MARGACLPLLVEPAVIECLYLSGGAVAMHDDTVEFVGWVELGGENRVCARFAMPLSAAIALYAAFGEQLNGLKRH